ncbi:MAG TPA: hypothetical protein DF480_04995, partial [Clostridiales bacterium]|nr:hypothetical protein [Clostridiales bacterium]
ARFSPKIALDGSILHKTAEFARGGRCSQSAAKFPTKRPGFERFTGVGSQAGTICLDTVSL